MLMGMFIPNNHRGCALVLLLIGCIHIGVGFGVARFTRQGNAKASECGTSDSTDSRAFSFIIYGITTMPNRGSL